MQKLLLLLLISCLGVVATAEAFERFPVVSTTELQELLDQRQRGNTDFILVNTLDEVIFRNQSIPGSINIPWSSIDSRYSELGRDKEKLIITYCIGHR